MALSKDRVVKADPPFQRRVSMSQGSTDASTVGMQLRAQGTNSAASGPHAIEPADTASQQSEVAAHGGGPLTFRDIYDSYFDFVWRSAANRGVPAAALDDVTQEVFIVIARKLAHFEGRSSLRTWIAAIVRRVVADFVRKRGNQPAAHESLEREPSLLPTPGEQLERKAALELLDGLLARMSSEQREVFVLHEIEEMAATEIAQLTGENENTIWTRLRAARRIFQEGVTRQRARRIRQEP